MKFLRKLEGAVGQFIEGLSRRSHGQHIQPVDLGRSLLRAMDENRRVSISKTYVPNVYTILLHPNIAADVKCMEQTLIEELKGVLVQKAEKESLSFIGSLHIVLESDDQLTPSEIHMETQFLEDPELGTADRHPMADANHGQTRIFTVLETKHSGARLLYSQSNGSIREFALGTKTSLGRGPRCTIQLPDPKASRLHAEIIRHGHSYHIIDRQSTNGTYVNGQPIQETKLSLHDIIHIGNSVLEFQEAASAEAVSKE